MIETKTLNINKKGKLVYITFPSFEKTGLVNHCFTTKLGGVSKGEFGTMNFSFNRGDNRDDVIENYRRVCDAIDTDINKLVLSKQTHTVNIRKVDENDFGKGIFKERGYDDVDAIITNVRGLCLVTQFADCVPILLLDPVKKAIGAAHGGWRGTVGKIAKLTIKAMSENYDSNPNDIIAAIAPSIGPCCFEVDEPVKKEFKKLNYNNIIKEKGNGKFDIDLWETNRQVLMEAGLKPENITVSDLCTKCHPDIFHSHRATNGHRGNNAAFLALK